MTERIHDFVAVGLGPFNLGLACLAEPIEGLDGVFLEQRAQFDWHPGMLLDDATLQTPFMADLVTLADPTSPYSFLNYCKQNGRLYSFYIREDFFLLRNEYVQYCRWAADRLRSIVFGARVEQVEYCEFSQCYLVHAACGGTGERRTWWGRRLVLGTGTVPQTPACCEGLGGNAIHSADYIDRKADLQALPSITVVGSGQSAAEVVHDLLADIDRHHYRLSWITRSRRFFPLDYSALTLEMTSPEYVDYFHALPADRRDAALREQQDLYKGIDRELLRDIRELLYRKSTTGRIDVELRTQCELESAAVVSPGDTLQLEFRHRELDQSFTHSTRALILATGYGYRIPGFIDGIAERIRQDARGRFDVARNYAVDNNRNEIFVQNAELHTHGFVSPDLGMACYRNSWILRALTGTEHYPIERHIGFQQFGVPDSVHGATESVDDQEREVATR